MKKRIKIESEPLGVELSFLIYKKKVKFFGLPGIDVNER